MSKVIVFATPVFLLLMALEFAWSRRRSSRTWGQQPFRLNDAINSISLGVLSQLSGVLTKLLGVGIYTLVFSAVAWYPESTLWSQWYGVVLALVFYDLCYYWNHRLGHTVAMFWAAHVVHHQSQHYNLSPERRLFRLDLLPPDGGGRGATRGVWRRCHDRPAVPVLGAHRAGWQTRLV